LTVQYHHCQDCHKQIPLYDVQGHYSGVCTSCLAKNEHPSAAGDTVIAKDQLAHLEELEQQRREAYWKDG
tara:strand:- start:119 stop:328 length:210 start_codon:yes stop_codon:yes gene_type:complete